MWNGLSDGNRLFVGMGLSQRIPKDKIKLSDKSIHPNLIGVLYVPLSKYTTLDFIFLIIKGIIRLLIVTR